jgi:integrase
MRVQYYSRPVLGLSALRSRVFRQLFGEYERKLFRSGYNPKFARLHLHSIAHFGVWIELEHHRLKTIDEDILWTFERHRSTCTCPGTSRNRHRQVLSGVRRFVQHLRELGVVQTVEARPPSVLLVQGFVWWMEVDRGVVETTLRSYGHYIADLVHALGDDPRTYTARGLRDFVAQRCRYCRRNSSRMVLAAVRMFLRHLAAEGQCRPGLEHALTPLANWSQASLPRGLPPEEIRRVLAMCPSTPRGLRDRAVLLLLIRLGLRAGDVSKLRFSDLCFQTATIRESGKGAREVRLPLPQPNQNGTHGRVRGRGLERGGSNEGGVGGGTEGSVNPRSSIGFAFVEHGELWGEPAVYLPTCLDLATTYAGLCLAADLLPYLVVLDGHALVVLSLGFGRRDWDKPSRAERELFDRGVLTDEEALRQLVEDEHAVAIECTGFACSDDGPIDFDDAIVAGQRALHDRPLLFALDIAELHYRWQVTPFATADPELWKELSSKLAGQYGLRRADGGMIPAIRLRDRLGKLFERHSLFGGRDRELEQLDAFVAERSSGYFFATGRSGFGKTALLANWVRSLEERGQRVCCHFISRTDGVADQDVTLRSLCEQLINAHQHLGDLPTSPQALRTLYVSLLRMPPPDGKPIIVVLDGLDEAHGWEPKLGSDLFPSDLAAGVRVVFSAREMAGRDWLAEIELQGSGVTPLVLTTLGTGEIAALLCRSGERGAALARDTNFVAAALDRSEGDPFYLHYLAQDVREGVVTTVEHLQHPQGLDAYLDKWWDDVSRATGEQAVSDLLGYLLVAKGPLSQRDLTEISQQDALSGICLGSLPEGDFDALWTLVAIAQGQDGDMQAAGASIERMTRPSNRAKALASLVKLATGKADALQHYAGQMLRLIETGDRTHLYYVDALRIVLEGSGPIAAESPQQAAELCDAAWAAIENMPQMDSTCATAEICARARFDASSACDHLEMIAPFFERKTGRTIRLGELRSIADAAAVLASHSTDRVLSVIERLGGLLDGVLYGIQEQVVLAVPLAAIDPDRATGLLRQQVERIGASTEVAPSSSDFESVSRRISEHFGGRYSLHRESIEAVEACALAVSQLAERAPDSADALVDLVVAAARNQLEGADRLDAFLRIINAGGDRSTELLRRAAKEIVVQADAIEAPPQVAASIRQAVVAAFCERQAFDDAARVIEGMAVGKLRNDAEGILKWRRRFAALDPLTPLEAAFRDSNDHDPGRASLVLLKTHGVDDFLGSGASVVIGHAGSFERLRLIHTLIPIMLLVAHRTGGAALMQQIVEGLEAWDRRLLDAAKLIGDMS